MLRNLREVMEDIEHLVKERGRLTKDEIFALYELREEDFAEIRREIISRKKVKSGPQKIGGFIAHEKRASEEVTGGAAKQIHRAEWETTVISRLVELLSLQTLAELLGHLRHALRQVRHAREGHDRPLRKEEMATALVLQHGIDLLAIPEIRNAIAAAKNTSAPKNWHPGKSAALAFVKATDLPSELAGLPRDESPPSFEYLVGKFQLQPLQDFQQEVSDKLRAGLDTIAHRSIVALPTGAGKTRVAVESIRDWIRARRGKGGNSVVVWLAHTEELCEQAYMCFRQVWESSIDVPPLFLVRFWGNYAKDRDAHQAILTRVQESSGILVSTPQRIANIFQGDRQPDATVIATKLRAQLGLLVIDEAHRAAAPSYRRVISILNPDNRPIHLVGLTATPFRREYADDPEAGTRELKEIFGSIIEPVNTLGPGIRAELQRRGVLACPVFQTIQTGTKMRMPSVRTHEVTQEDAEKIDYALSIRADDSRRRLAIFRHIVPVARDPRSLILYFGPTVSDAECMAFLLREEGISASVISGYTRDASRRELVESFKSGTIRVLCNCEVLTTGFDAPRVSHVVMARPTVSQVLYEQMVGRGLRGRLFGGTDSCVILDCQDDFGSTPVRPEMGYTRFRRIWERETESLAGRA